MAELELRLFGTPQIVYANTPIYIGRNKAVALLSYLAVCRQTQLRTELAHFLWDDDGSVDHKAALRRLIYYLRQQLPVECLTVERDTVRINDNVMTDVQRFQTLIESVRCHEHLPFALCEDCLKRLQGAVDLAQDTFLAGFYVKASPRFEAWQRIQAQLVHNNLQTIFQAIVESLSVREDFETALTYANRWLQFSPMHEQLCQYLLLLHAWLGHKPKVVEIYQNWCNLLRLEFDDVPSPELSALYGGLIADQVPSASQMFGHLETQSESPEMEIDIRFRHHPTPFVGRERQVEDLMEWLQKGEQRLLTIVGIGGVGKSRLVEELLLRYTAETHKAFDYVPLETKVLAEVNVSSDILLVLDGFDSTTHSVETLAKILHTTPLVKLMVTARHRLGLAGETVYRLQGLNYPPTDSMDDALAYPAVQFFVQVAQQSSGSFQLSDQSSQAIVNLCRYAGGIPLVIEQIAPLTRLLDMSMLYEELLYDLNTLFLTDRYLISDQSTLLDMLETTWQQLTTEEQATLRRFISGVEIQNAPLAVQYSLMEKLSLDKKLMMTPFLKQFIMDKIS